MKYFLVACVLLSSLSGCYYDTEEELYGNNGCDTTAVKFGAHIAPVIKDNCQSCHNSANASGNVNLEGYTAIRGIAQDNQRLHKVVSHAQGVSPMPPMRRLPECAIQQIKIWVDQGAPQN